MKVAIVFALCVAATLAAPPTTNDQAATVLRYESDNIGVDGYQYA